MEYNEIEAFVRSTFDIYVCCMFTLRNPYTRMHVVRASSIFI